MAAKYKARVEFLLVYIREAHPIDGWQTQANVKAGIAIAKAKTFEEKQSCAGACVRNLGIKFTTVVDKMDAAAELNYVGWPDRMYVVGKNGLIAWKGEPGPAGFKPPLLEAAIQSELKKSETSSA